MKIELKILNKGFYNLESCGWMNNLCLPRYATAGSAAMDLVCTEDITIYPGEVVAIHTGLAIWIGSGDETTLGLAKENGWGIKADITPRSSLGTRGLVLANIIGTIDEDYQGELIVQAWNRSAAPEEKAVMDYAYPAQMRETKENYIELKAGDRFAQLCFVPVIKASWQLVEEFSHDTVRGIDGFGSTGA